MLESQRRLPSTAVAPSPRQLMWRSVLRERPPIRNQLALVGVTDSFCIGRSPSETADARSLRGARRASSPAQSSYCPIGMDISLKRAWAFARRVGLPIASQLVLDLIRMRCRSRRPIGFFGVDLALMSWRRETRARGLSSSFHPKSQSVSSASLRSGKGFVSHSRS